MNVVVALVAGTLIFAAARLVVARSHTRRLERRVNAHLGAQDSQRVEPRLPAPRTRLGRILHEIERALVRYPAWHAFEERVERAGVERRPVEILAAVAVATPLALLVGAATGSLLALLICALAPAAGTWAVFGVRARRRLHAFDEQLPDLLTALGGSLRAGHGFLQSLQAVAEDAPDPAGRELRRALAETRVGRPVEEALAAVGRRVPSRDLMYVLTAITIQRQIGGSLAGLFETVTDTVRQRHQFARKVRALTATGRSSAHALFALPIATAGLLSLVNHGYLVPLFNSHLGRAMLVGSGVSMVVGATIVRRIVSIKG
jgi:tight adherence protein B